MIISYVVNHESKIVYAIDGKLCKARLQWHHLSLSMCRSLASENAALFAQRISNQLPVRQLRDPDLLKAIK